MPAQNKRINKKDTFNYVVGIVLLHWNIKKKMISIQEAGDWCRCCFNIVSPEFSAQVDNSGHRLEDKRHDIKKSTVKFLIHSFWPRGGWRLLHPRLRSRLDVEGVSRSWSIMVPAPECDEGAAFTPSLHRALEVLSTVAVAGSISISISISIRRHLALLACSAVSSQCRLEISFLELAWKYVSTAELRWTISDLTRSGDWPHSAASVFSHNSYRSIWCFVYIREADHFFTNHISACLVFFNQETFNRSIDFYPALNISLSHP